jgi:hypothetical protein
MASAPSSPIQGQAGRGRHRRQQADATGMQAAISTVLPYQSHEEGNPKLEANSGDLEQLRSGRWPAGVGQARR